MDEKQRVGRELASRVRSGDVIGVGTGTTVDAALIEIARRIQSEKLEVSCVPTSLQTAWKCKELGLTVLDRSYPSSLAFGFDGADAVDPGLRAIKGRGGAMLQEKILARKCLSYTLIIGVSKLFDNLADSCPIPIEVVPEAVRQVEESLNDLGALSVILRTAREKHGPVITESGNIILDATFSDIPDELDRDINTIVGVVETGLFLTQANEVLISEGDSVRSLLRGQDVH